MCFTTCSFGFCRFPFLFLADFPEPERAPRNSALECTANMVDLILPLQASVGAAPDHFYTERLIVVKILWTFWMRFAGQHHGFYGG